MKDEISEEVLDGLEQQLAKEENGIRRLAIGWWVASVIVFVTLVATGVLWWLSGDVAGAVVPLIFAAINALYMFNVYMLNKINKDLRAQLRSARDFNLHLALGIDRGDGPPDLGVIHG